MNELWFAKERYMTEKSKAGLQVGDWVPKLPFHCSDHLLLILQEIKRRRR
jgi:hypothetical protein